MDSIVGQGVKLLEKVTTKIHRTVGATAAVTIDSTSVGAASGWSAPPVTDRAGKKPEGHNRLQGKPQQAVPYRRAHALALSQTAESTQPRGTRG